MPMDSTTPDRVRNVIAEVLGRAPAAILPDSHLADDLQADSFDRIEIALALEEEFGLPDMLSDDHLEAARIVADLTALVDRALDARRLVGA